MTTETGNDNIFVTTTDRNRNSHGKSGIFDNSELEEAVSRLLRQRLTTGNGNTAAKTGYKYIYLRKYNI